MPELRHPHPFGPHGPYDPMRHHHHDHPPYMVDRCADQCDDQLPLLSQVGRGLQGFGYRVEVTKDNLTETELSGFLYDPHTGTVTKEWTSENVNGGHLYYAYNYRPWTDPKTFTITFKYVRPGRNAKPDGTVWSWVSPAIPYIWNNEDENIGAGVATVYLKSTADGPWPTGRPTDAWLAKHEKLRYPDGMDHDSMNAPNPMEPYSVNLTFGIGGDIDVPSVDDIAKIIGVTPETIRNLVQGDLPTDTFPNGRNVKQYVDNLYNVRSTNEALLKVTKNTSTAGKIEFVLEPTDQLANLEAGPGIKIAKVGDKYKVSANILAGSGIEINNSGGTLIISNAALGGDWKTLQAGRDFDYTWRQGWYRAASPEDQPAQRVPAEADKLPPFIQAIPTYNIDGDIIGAIVSIGGLYWTNSRDLSHKDGQGNYDQFMFRHGDTLDNVPLSAMLSFTFKDGRSGGGLDWSALNSKSIKDTVSTQSNIWSVAGTDKSSIRDDTIDGWERVGASWPVTCGFSKNANYGNGFVMSAVNIADGWNTQYDAQRYNKAHLCIRGWCAIGYQITIA